MATLTLSGSSVYLTFLAAETADKSAGALFKLGQADEEVLATEGVDGRRWRTKSFQMVPVEVETIAGVTSWASAMTLAQTHQAMKSLLVNLVWTSGGSSYRYRDVHISEVSAKPVQGTAISAADGSYSAHVRTTWIFEATDFSETSL